MATYTINVTQEDIDRGIEGECDSCALALAMSRCLGEPVWVGVAKGGKSDWAFAQSQPAGEQRVWRTLPVEADKFRRDFDCGDRRRLPLRPFSFEVTV